MAFLGGFFDPPAMNVNIPTMASAPANAFNYNPNQIAPTQQNMLSGIQNLGQYNLGGQFLPMAGPIGMGMINDPNAAFMTGGAGTAANLGMGAAFNQYGAGTGIYGTAFDPQNDLYNRLLSQTTDRARANAMAAGLGNTPVGVSGVDWAQNQFNIDWQNNLLNRMITGAGAASGLQAGAAPLFMQSAMMPWQAGQTIGGANLGTLGTLSNLGISASQIPGQQIAGWQQGLGTMANLQQQSYNQQQQQFQDAMAIANLQLQQEKQAAAEQQSMFSGMGKVLGGIGGFALGGLPGAMIGSSIFGGMGGGGGGGGGMNMSGLNSSPFGGMFSSGNPSGLPNFPGSFGLPGGW